MAKMMLFKENVVQIGEDKRNNNDNYENADDDFDVYEALW